MFFKTKQTAKSSIGLIPFVAAAAMVIGLEVLFRYFSGGWATALWQKLGLMGGLRLLQGVVAWVVLNLDGYGPDRLGLRSESLKKGVLHGLYWVIGFGICAVLGGLFVTMNGLPWANLIKTSLPQTPLGLGLFFAVGGIVSPIAEELVFRGIVYGFFRRWGVGFALLVSTLLFVVAHGSGAVWVVPLVGGIVFAVSYEWSRSLAAPIMIHVAGNLAIFGLSWIASYLHSS